VVTYASAELNSLIGELTPEEKAVPEIRHALLVSTAISTNNYHSLFQLYVSAPNMGGYIMDFFVPRARALALIVMCKASVHTSKVV
jgi:SAC3 family protein LENG8/THP3